MDLKETYDFLLQPRRTRDEIWAKDLRRRELKACLLPAGVAYDKDQVQASPEDQMARIMAEVADLDRQIEELRQRRALQILEISQTICRINDPREETILDAYYLGNASMGEIAEKMHYSIQHIYRMHDSALAAVEEILAGRSA